MNEVMQVRAASWATMIKQRNDSGLTINEWCAVNGIQDSVYYYRLNRLRKMALDMSCFFFADAVPTGSKAWSGRGMDSVYFISGSKPDVSRWPRSQEEAARISPEELHLLLTGMTILERSFNRECRCTEIG